MASLPPIAVTGWPPPPLSCRRSAAAEHSESGLMVVVQSDHRSVVRPARELGEQFVKNSFWMLVVMVSVLLALWYVVVRMFREPTAGLNRPATPVAESTPLHAMTTMPVADRQKL